MTHSLARIFAILALPLLAACAGTAKQSTPEVVPGYEGVQDGEFFIEAVPAKYLQDGNVRTEVAYTGPEAPGTVVVDTFARKLYLVGEGGTATRYPIAVGREGLSFRGQGTVGRKAEWPSWQPTANMIRTRPDLYAEYAGGNEHEGREHRTVSNEFLSRREGNFLTRVFFFDFHEQRLLCF